MCHLTPDLLPICQVAESDNFYRSESKAQPLHVDCLRFSAPPSQGGSSPKFMNAIVSPIALLIIHQYTKYINFGLKRNRTT